MPYAESMFTVRGTRIRVLRSGSGPPLIFLHGASGHVGWLPFLERLSQRFDVIAPEHPGFGQSDDPPWLDRPSDLAYFYLDLIGALKLDGVHLMGTSLGGWISAEENAHRFYSDPDRVRRRLEGLSSADPRILVRNRSTVVRLAYPDFVNP